MVFCMLYFLFQWRMGFFVKTNLPSFYFSETLNSVGGEEEQAGMLESVMDSLPAVDDDTTTENLLNSTQMLGNISSPTGCHAQVPSKKSSQASSYTSQGSLAFKEVIGSQGFATREVAQVTPYPNRDLTQKAACTGNNKDIVQQNAYPNVSQTLGQLSGFASNEEGPVVQRSADPNHREPEPIQFGYLKEIGSSQNNFSRESIQTVYPAKEQINPLENNTTSAAHPSPRERAMGGSMICKESTSNRPKLETQNSHSGIVWTKQRSYTDSAAQELFDDGKCYEQIWPA